MRRLVKDEEPKQRVLELLGKGLKEGQIAAQLGLTSWRVTTLIG